MKHKQQITKVCSNLRFIWNLAPGSFIEMIAFGLLNCGLSVANVWAIRQMLSVVHGGYGETLFCSVGIYALLLLLSAAYSVWYKRYRVQFHVILDFEKQLRAKLHEKSGRISNETFETHQSNAVIRMADSARQHLFRYVEIWVSIVLAILQAVAVVSYVASFQIWFLLLLPLAIVPPCLELAYQSKHWQKYHKAIEQCQWEESEYLKALTDEVACKESRVTYAATLLSDKWNDSRSTREEIENKRSRKMLGLRLILTPASILGSSGGFLVSVLLLYFGKIDYASCTAGIAAYGSLLAAFSSLAGMFGNESQYRKMIQPFFQYWEFPERAGDSDKLDFEQEIRLDHVSFRYPGQSKNAVEDIDLTIRKGEVIAIVGENGAGKTTLSNLILGLFQPSSGAIYYDQTNTAHVKEPAIHKLQSTVSQTFNRYKMTARDNISIGDFEKQREQEILQRYNEFFSGSSITPDTLLGKEFGGTELSGGQWQQLSCARGFYRDCEILVLDEATSAIDPLKEKAMYDSFRKELAGKTGIIITHRLSAVSLASRIVVLDQGRIVQSGTHQELLREEGLYSQFWNAQTKQFDIKS